MKNGDRTGRLRKGPKTYDIGLYLYQDGQVFMNNRQTNRRRGRGNNNRTQNNNRNGYDNQNRVDNRARGNAAQMLEKYKKLAQDAQHNGDRVQAEYYHQFADHYFRVLADYRSRQEESRPQREWRDDREGNDWRDEERDGVEDSEEGEAVTEQSGEEDDYRRPQRQEREPREDRGPRNDRNDRNPRGRNNSRRDNYEPRDDRPREDRPRDDKPRDDKPRDDRPRAERSTEERPGRNRVREDRVANDGAGLDISILPPAIGAANNEEVVVETKPARKPRAPRKPKTVDDTEIATAAE
jgi:hypothetical protein